MGKAKAAGEARKISLLVSLTSFEYLDEVLGSNQYFRRINGAVEETFVDEHRPFVEFVFSVPVKTSDFRFCNVVSRWASTLCEAIEEMEIVGLEGEKPVYKITEVDDDGLLQAQKDYVQMKGSPNSSFERQEQLDHALRLNKLVLQRDGNLCANCRKPMLLETMKVGPLLTIISKANNRKAMSKEIGSDALIGFCYFCDLNYKNTIEKVCSQTDCSNLPFAQWNNRLEEIAKKFPIFETEVLLTKKLLLAVQTGDQKIRTAYGEMRRDLLGDPQIEQDMKKYRDIFVRDNSIECCWCGDAFSKQKLPSLEHVIPRSLKGPNNRLNYLVACKKCNECRGIHPVHVWIEKCYEKGQKPNLQAFALRLSELSALEGELGAFAQKELDNLLEYHLIYKK